MMSHAGVHEKHSEHCFDLLTKKFEGAPKRKMQTKVTNTKKGSKKQKTPDSIGAGPSATNPAVQVDTARSRRQINPTRRYAPDREGRNDKKLKESD